MWIKVREREDAYLDGGIELREIESGIAVHPMAVIPVGRGICCGGEIEELGIESAAGQDYRTASRRRIDRDRLICERCRPRRLWRRLRIGPWWIREAAPRRRRPSRSCPCLNRRRRKRGAGGDRCGPVALRRIIAGGRLGGGLEEEEDARLDLRHPPQTGTLRSTPPLVKWRRQDLQ